MGGAHHRHSHHWHSPGLPLSLMPAYDGDWGGHPRAGSLTTVTILGALRRKKLSSGGSQPSLPWKCFKHQALLKRSTSCRDTCGPFLTHDFPLCFGRLTCRACPCPDVECVNAGLSLNTAHVALRLTLAGISVGLTSASAPTSPVRLPCLP